MRSVTKRYPVDRYLVESSKKFEMVNIIDDDIWNTEPALKPEDEIILRKLHEMLQSTADDLKLLSGELSKFHEPGVQVQTTPTPLDEEFNEKVHIEEIVNAKFHGYKIIEKSSSCAPEYKLKQNAINEFNSTVKSKNPNNTNSNVPMNNPPTFKKPIINRNLRIAPTKVMQINGNEKNAKTENLNNGIAINAPAVAYNEYSYKYVEPKPKLPQKQLYVQEMPSISIRSELKEQKVLQLDIIPENKEPETQKTITKNVAVVEIQHDIPNPKPLVSTNILPIKSHEPIHHHPTCKTNTVRKVSKMSSCDSSGSTNHISSDTQINYKIQKKNLTNIRSSPKSSERIERKKAKDKKGLEKRPHLNLDEWRIKLNSVYGPSNSKKDKSSKPKSKGKLSSKKSNIPQNIKPVHLNKIEYIPYSKLTVGGARASDIEREISDVPNKKDIPLSPILDRILSSRDHSFSKSSAQKHKSEDGVNILTTSDENLLQEVIDIERTVGETLSKNLKSISISPVEQKLSSNSEGVKENESYADDFEDEKSDRSEQSRFQKSNNTNSKDGNKVSDDENNYTIGSEGEYNISHSQDLEPVPSASKTNIHNLTCNKISNLSLKDSVDIFEFVHSVDTQDSATQSNSMRKILPKETQTSPTNDRNIQPIHNDLWPSIDPKGEVEKLFQAEKEFIKKLIVEEYGDLLVKNIDKPSTSKDDEIRKNVAAFQKNTQTSPAHVKNVMTSPTRTKTRTTSPFPRLIVDHHTSPMIFVTNEDDAKVEVKNEDDPGNISINLSSPRFSLRLPLTSREVLTNLGDSVPRTEKKSANVQNVKKINITLSSTSSLEADSSEISSLGEVKLRKKISNSRVHSDSESVTSSSSKYSSDFQTGILPLRSEGEISLGRKKKSNKQNKSEGEASLGCCN